MFLKTTVTSHNITDFILYAILRVAISEWNADILFDFPYSVEIVYFFLLFY